MTSSGSGQLRARRGAVIAACLVSAFVLASCGKGSSGAAGTSGGNDADAGPPVINAAFGARMPRKCNPVKHVPNQAEAAALAQCATENGGEAGAFNPMIY